MPGPPTQAAYLTFLRGVVGVPTSAMPDSAPIIGWTFDFALNIVNLALACVPSQPTSWSIYEIAVYNLGADTLINWAPDPEGSPVYKDGLPYFAWLRKQYAINSFVAGVIESSSDQGTSESLLVPEVFKNLTIGQLQNLKTPYGRQYLALAQSYGPIWGLA